MLFDAELKGLEGIITDVRKLSESLDSDIAGHLYRTGHKVLTYSMEKVPVDTGFLKNTGYVDRPIRGISEITVRVGYHARYSLAVHERLDVRHKNGQAKFLEKAVKEVGKEVADLGRIFRKI